jgi:DNA-binding TFAR19-related protein (PDSD5 family)
MFNTEMELTPLGGAFGYQGLTQMSGGTQRQARREIERVQAQALVADTREQARALLTNTALQNVGALSALEQHLIQVAPIGEARYKHIVDSYALGAAVAIQRW